MKTTTRIDGPGHQQSTTFLRGVLSQRLGWSLTGMLATLVLVAGPSGRQPDSKPPEPQSSEDRVNSVAQDQPERGWYLPLKVSDSSLTDWERENLATYDVDAFLVSGDRLEKALLSLVVANADRSWGAAPWRDYAGIYLVHRVARGEDSGRVFLGADAEVHLGGEEIVSVKLVTHNLGPGGFEWRAVKLRGQFRDEFDDCVLPLRREGGRLEIVRASFK